MDEVVRLQAAARAVVHSLRIAPGRVLREVAAGHQSAFQSVIR